MDKGKDGLGTLRKLAPELRIMIYQQTLGKYKQIFDVHRPSNAFVLSARPMASVPFASLPIRHSQAIPNLMSTSRQLCAEVLDSAFSKSSCTIVVGRNRLTTNFPLTVTDEPGQRLTLDTALIPTCRELFIGIEIPSPREVNDFAQLRLNMKSLVHLLNNIAARTGKDKKFPQIRVSFESDTYRAGLMYHRNDFETVVAPLRKLRIPPQDDVYNAHRNILIDRSCRWMTLDKRHETCRMIEDAVQDPATTSKELLYHQLSIDIRLDLALLVLHSTGSDVLVQPSRETFARLAVASREFVAWHREHGFRCARWVARLAVICESARPDLGQLRSVVYEVVGYRDGPVFAQMVSWVNGHLSIANPFWVEQRASEA